MRLIRSREPEIRGGGMSEAQCANGGVNYDAQKASSNVLGDPEKCLKDLSTEVMVVN